MDKHSRSHQTGKVGHYNDNLITNLLLLTERIILGKTKIRATRNYTAAILDLPGYDNTVKHFVETLKPCLDCVSRLALVVEIPPRSCDILSQGSRGIKKKT